MRTAVLPRPPCLLGPLAEQHVSRTPFLLGTRPATHTHIHTPDLRLQISASRASGSAGPSSPPSPLDSVNDIAQRSGPRPAACALGTPLPGRAQRLRGQMSGAGRARVLGAAKMSPGQIQRREQATSPGQVTSPREETSSSK